MLSSKIRSGREVKLLDPRDASTESGGAELLDPTLAKRGDQWWIFLAGQAKGYGATDLYCAFLPPQAPLSATGWKLLRDAEGELISLAGRNSSYLWDGHGGRHCPAYARGWDPHKSEWVERIYYAGAAENLWGPYTIGYLQWDGSAWVDSSQPIFVAAEAWERGSVYEPNVIFHDGKWKLWYVAGSNLENYLVQGYAESEDGRGNWTGRQIFAPDEQKLFDFCVRERWGMFEAVFARVSIGGEASAETGLWWCRAEAPAKTLAEWGEPVQILTAEDRGWHSGPWKPSFAFCEEDPTLALVFFDGCYRTSDPGPFPFAFTLGCLEVDLP